MICTRDGSPIFLPSHFSAKTNESSQVVSSDEKLAKKTRGIKIGMEVIVVGSAVLAAATVHISIHSYPLV